MADFIFLGAIITVDGACSHEIIKREDSFSRVFDFLLASAFVVNNKEYLTLRSQPQEEQRSYAPMERNHAHSHFSFSISLQTSHH